MDARRAGVLGFALVGLSLLGCPGKSSVAVTISPSTATVAAGGTQAFTATVTGNSNTAVTWSVTESAGGSVSASGSYTAPSAAGTFHVVATSVADVNASAIAVVTVTGSQGVSVTVAPTTATLNPAGTQTFIATVSGSSNTAVNWTVMEGAAGGTVTSGGLYTAPAATGTYHVVATSVADATRSGSATVTVTNTPVISVSVSPPTATVGPSQTQQFAATVMNSANMMVTWTVMEVTGGNVSATGLYTAPLTPGTYHVIATSQADATKSGSATVTVNPLGNGTTISGTVTYAGAKTGRVYVQLYDTGGNPRVGTSLAAPGAYMLRGVVGCSNCTVRAFMDVVGSQAVLPSADPIGQSAQITINGTSQSNIGVALTDPGVGTPAPPTNIGAFFSNDAAVMGWQDPAAAYDHANVYSLATVLAVCPLATAAYTTHKTVAASGKNGPTALIQGLTTGSKYCFLVTTLANGVESMPSAAYGPVTASAPTGNFSIPGTITFTGVTPTGPLYVAAVKGGNGAGPSAIYFTDVAAPVSPQAFTITGVPNGTYKLYAFIDMANAGSFVPGFVGNTGTNFPQQVTINNANAPSVGVTLSAANATPLALTQHQYNMGDQYVLVIAAESSVKIPVTVAATAGPALSSVIDLPLQTGGGSGTNSTFATYFFLGATPPNVGDAYTLDVTYSDGTAAMLTAPVTGVISGLATLTGPPPGGSASSTTPTFTWTLPSGIPGSDVLQLQVNPQMGGSSTWQAQLAPTATTVVYNADGSGTALSATTPYSWSLQIVDSYGNTAQATANFMTP